MENLGLYISELLAEHDCVIVPGFGGFVARPAPAQFSKAGSLLLPPGKSLVFNKNLSNSDGLLTHHVSEKLGISYREAQTRIEQWVAESRKQLETQKRLELESTGILYYSPENNLLFEPAASSNHQVSSFGLVAVRAVRLEKTKIPQAIGEKEYKRPQPRITGGKLVTRISVVVSSLLLLFFLIVITAKQLPVTQALASLNPFASKEGRYEYKPYHMTPLFSVPAQKAGPKAEKNVVLTLSDNSSKGFVVSPDTAVIDKTTVKKNVSTSLSSNNNFNSPFQIVVGCFAIERNAHKLIEQLRKDHIAAGISGRNLRGLYIVSVAGFTTESMARTKLEQVKERFPSAWILVK